MQKWHRLSRADHDYSKIQMRRKTSLNNEQLNSAFSSWVIQIRRGFSSDLKDKSPVSLDAHSAHSKVGFWRPGPWALPSSINSQYSCAGSFTLRCSRVTVRAFINKVTGTTSAKSEIRLQSEEPVTCYEVCDWLPVFCAGILCLQQWIIYKLRIYSSSSFIEIKWSHHWSAD